MRAKTDGAPVVMLTVSKAGLAKRNGGRGVEYVLFLNWGPLGGAIEIGRGSRSQVSQLRDAYIKATVPTDDEAYDLLRRVARHLRAVAQPLTDRPA